MLRAAGELASFHERLVQKWRDDEAITAKINEISA
jgi:hypothetical protein